jgi:hypothetical protein
MAPDESHERGFFAALHETFQQARIGPRLGHRSPRIHS